jgi:hypothetical protein
MWIWQEYEKYDQSSLKIAHIWSAENLTLKSSYIIIGYQTESKHLTLSLIYTLICKIYTLICTIYTLICKIHTLICKFYTLICKIYILICKFYTLISTKNKEWTCVFQKGRQFLLHTWHLLCYSCYKPDDKTWMRKGPGSVYANWNISVVICDTDIPLWSIKSRWRSPIHV